jgi:hypothetical protein
MKHMEENTFEGIARYSTRCKTTEAEWLKEDGMEL